MNDLLAMPEVNRKLAGGLSGADISYPKPLFAGYDAGAKEWTGRRLPDADLRLADGTTSSLYTLLQKGNWVDLLLDTDTRSPPANGISPSWIRVERAKLLDPSSSLQPLAAVLVRPDGHVAYARTRDAQPNRA